MDCKGETLKILSADIITKSEIQGLYEMRKRLEKEIAYSEYLAEKFEDDDHNQEIANYIQTHLQIVQGTYTHEPEYDEKFEKEWRKKK